MCSYRRRLKVLREAQKEGPANPYVENDVCGMMLHQMVPHADQAQVKMRLPFSYQGQCLLLVETD